MVDYKADAHLPRSQSLAITFKLFTGRVLSEKTTRGCKLSQLVVLRIR